MRHCIHWYRLGTHDSKCFSGKCCPWPRCSTARRCTRREKYGSETFDEEKEEEGVKGAARNDKFLEDVATKGDARKEKFLKDDARDQERLRQVI